LRTDFGEKPHDARLVGRHLSSVYGMIFGPIMMIAFIALTVLIIAWLLRALGLGWQSDMDGKSALDILKDRFARGKIERAEYEERRKLFSGS
jgi:putative membrane protein